MTQVESKRKASKATSNEASLEEAQVLQEGQVLQEAQPLQEDGGVATDLPEPAEEEIPELFSEEEAPLEGEDTEATSEEEMEASEDGDEEPQGASEDPSVEDAETEALDEEDTQASELDAGGEDVEEAEEQASGPGIGKAQPEPLGRAHLKSVVESLIFVSNKPIAPAQLGKSARASTDEVKAVIEDLQKDYEGRGIELAAVGTGFQFRSSMVNAPFVRDHVAAKPVRLTRPQLETLAIVAYKQPVTRPEVDEVRGVDSGAALKVLDGRGLVRVLGRKEEPGRPLLYGTTPQFLEFFGLQKLRDLPTLREFGELSDESRSLFEKKMGEPLSLDVAAELEAKAQAAQQAALETEDAAEEQGDGDDAADAGEPLEVPLGNGTSENFDLQGDEDLEQEPTVRESYVGEILGAARGAEDEEEPSDTSADRPNDVDAADDELGEDDSLRQAEQGSDDIADEDELDDDDDDDEFDDEDEE